MSKLQKMLAWQGLTDSQKEIVQKLKDSFNDEVITKEVKKVSFSPSALGWGEGKCPRRWYFYFNGIEVTETLTAKSKFSMQNGTDSHAMLQEQFEKNPELDIEIEREIKYSDPPIRGFIDGVIQSSDGKEIPIEIKTANDMAFGYRKTSFKAASYHKLQLLMYLNVIDADFGLFFYFNKNDYDNLIIPLERDEAAEQYIEYLFDWMRKVHAAYEADTLPNFFEGKRKNSKICGDCPISKACHERGEAENGVDLPLLELPND